VLEYEGKHIIHTSSYLDKSHCAVILPFDSKQHLRQAQQMHYYRASGVAERDDPVGISDHTVSSASSFAMRSNAGSSSSLPAKSKFSWVLPAIER